MTMPARSGPAPRGSRVSDPWPPREDFHALAEQGNLVPVYREILADLETPVSAFLKIDAAPTRFLLESVEGGEKWGRYSFLGTAPARGLRESAARRSRARTPGGACTRARPTADPLAALRELLAGVPPGGAAAACRASPAAPSAISATTWCAFFERLPATRARRSRRCPTSACMLVDDAAGVRQRRRRRSRSCRTPTCGDGDDPRARLRRGVRAHRRARRAPAARRRCAAGAAPATGRRAVRVQLRRRTPTRRSSSAPRSTSAPATSSRWCWRSASSCPLRAAPFNVYRCLRTVNPSPYMFYLRARRRRRWSARRPR